jgi:hypothetical protein
VDILLVVVPLVAVLVPLVAWFLDESSGRPGWLKLAQVREHFRLGDGAFRAAQVDQTRTEVLRDRAPWSVRLVALSCYLPLGVAILSALPWLLGVLLMSERRYMHGLDAQVNGMLVAVFPVGCWAATRMWSLGRALLNSNHARFHGALPATTVLQVCLNGAIVVAAVVMAIRHPHRQEVWLLLVAPTLTLVQLAVVAAVGWRHLWPAPARFVAPDAETTPPPPDPA